MLYKYVGKYVITTFGVDLVDHPPDEELRTYGLKACCMKKHTDNIPSFEDFLCTAIELMMARINEVTTAEKVIEMINSCYNEFTKKAFKVEINNINANPDVDGAIKCDKFPNALFTCYLNGCYYDVDENFYDPIETPDDNNEMHKKFDIIMQEQLKMDHEIQEKLEREAAEKKAKEKKEN